MSVTIHNSFYNTVSLYPDKTVLMYKGDDKKYKDITYSELLDLVNSVASSLRGLGVRKGDAVGVLSHNRPEWAVVDLAVLKLGGIVVPIYPTLPPSYVKYIMDDSKIKLIFAESAGLFDMIDSIRSESSTLKQVVLFDAPKTDDTNNFILFDEMTRAGSQTADEEVAVSGDDAATIVYTSGTTGEPKGVVLTHDNIVSNAVAIQRRCRVTHEDIIVSYLPLSHMFERTSGYYAMLFAGATIAYAEELSTLAEDVATIRPTILLAVPRVIEKAYDKVVKKVEGSTFIKRVLVSRAITHLNAYANLKYRRTRIPLLLRVKYAIYNTFIASQFRSIAGGRLRIIASGGAPLDQKIAKVLHILGFNIVEGYGLTETSPIVSCHPLDDIRLGTVGKPLDGIEVSIGEDDEILVKGPNVMRGYLNKPEETAMVIDSDGWFHTGDQGRFDEHGNLVITGRIKELIVTSYGKKIASAPIEARITKSRYIAQAVLYGDTKKFIVAFIVPDREAIEYFAKERNILYGTYPELLEKDEIKTLVRHVIQEATEDLASYEQIKVFTLIPEEFTVENGLLTPTLKMKKSKIAERYRDELNAMYEQSKGGQE